MRVTVVSRLLPLIAVATALVSVNGGCGQTEKPPLPEALVVVDTNLPVPLAVSRLRVDLYSEDGTWFESSDFTRDDPKGWPVSFGVYADEGLARGVFVRLRAYPEGYVAAYRGERFRDWSAPLAAATNETEPRLVVDGIDRTPFEEPLPIVTVDRVVFVRLRPNERGRIRVTLSGACIGTMAKLGAGGRPSLDSESCVDVEKERAPIQEPAFERTLDRPSVSLVGTWLAQGSSCEPDAPDSEAVCVPGGATMFGSVENSDYVPDQAAQLDTQPVRVFGLRRFYIDRDEVTVGRFRKAIADGHTGGRPRVNDGPVGPKKTEDDCTYTSKPGDREDWAATCVSWDAARAFCKFVGGDLPSEVQWEHVATVAGHDRKKRYPWGNEEPACERSVFDRENVGPQTGTCAALGAGPQDPKHSADDVSPLGIRRLYGSTQEWTRDDPAPPTADCWLKGSLVNPGCAPTVGAERRVARGSGYFGASLRSSQRFAIPSFNTFGFRCAYERRP